MSVIWRVCETRRLGRGEYCRLLGWYGDTQRQERRTRQDETRLALFNLRLLAFAVGNLFLQMTKAQGKHLVASLKEQSR